MKDFNADSPDVNTSTLTHLVAKTIDTVLNASPLTLRILGNQKTWKGSKYKQPIKYAQNSNGKAFNGLDRFNTVKSNNFINMEFDPTGYTIPTVIDSMEQDVNATARITDLAARQLESDGQDMIDDLADLFWTLQADKNFLSVIDAYDDGTLGATSYGGLLRSTYTGIKGSYVAIGGDLTLANLRTQLNATKHGMRKANMMVTTEDIFGYYEALITPTVQTNYSPGDLAGLAKITRTGAVSAGTDLKGQQGFDALYHAGIPMVADEKATSGYLVHINDDDLNFIGLKSTKKDYTPIQFKGSAIKGVYSDVPKTTGFAFSGFKTPIDQYAEVGHMILMGNLVCDNPRYGGIMITVTG